MRCLHWRSFIAVALLASVLVGCSKLHLGGNPPPQSTQLPSPRQLKKISYMSQSSGPDGRRVFDRLGQARSCRDLELAMRWNRPPDVKSGPFEQRMVYLSASIPADLPKQSEVFFSGVIERGESLPSGGSGWSLKMKDGSELQAIEPVEYRQKQEQLQQEGGAAAFVKPYVIGRTLCAYGIYQGAIGRSLDQQRPVPLVSVLFAIDRRR